jgi:LysM repeat protein
MKDDPAVQMNDDRTDARGYSPKRGRTGSDSNRLLPALLVVLLVVFFGGGIFYFFTRRSTEGDATFRSKMAALEEKTAGLEKQVVNLQGKSGTESPDPALVQRVEALTQRVEALEKRTQSTIESKAKTAPPKPVVKGQKRYHRVQKGETLSMIGKKYGTAVEELRKLNNLSADQSVRTGQRLLVSVGR